MTTRTRSHKDPKSIYAVTIPEARQRKDREMRADGRRLLRGYFESDINIDGTSAIPQVDLDAYQSDLVAEYNNAKDQIALLTTVEAIRDFKVQWPSPAI